MPLRRRRKPPLTCSNRGDILISFVEDDPFTICMLGGYSNGSIGVYGAGCSKRATYVPMADVPNINIAVGRNKALSRAVKNLVKNHTAAWFRNGN